MAKYIKCPRCDLNYILADEELCDICKAELGLSTDITLLDDILEEEDQVKLCPICKTNTIGIDEDMCDLCLSAQQAELNSAEDTDDWRSYIDDEPEEMEEVVDIPLEDLDEEEEDDFDSNTFDDEENVEEEDFDNFEDIGSYDEDDYLDDDEDDDFED